MKNKLNITIFLLIAFIFLTVCVSNVIAQIREIDIKPITEKEYLIEGKTIRMDKSIIEKQQRKEIMTQAEVKKYIEYVGNIKQLNNINGNILDNINTKLINSAIKK